DQCETARTELGFAADHPHDTEVCDEFVEEMCDEEPPIVEDHRRLFGEQSSSSHAQSNSARRNLETVVCVKDSHELHSKPCGEIKKPGEGGSRFLPFVYKVALNFLNLKKDIHDEIKQFSKEGFETACGALPWYGKGLCNLALLMYTATAKVLSLVLITVKHVLTTLQDEFSEEERFLLPIVTISESTHPVFAYFLESALIGKGPADVLNDNALNKTQNWTVYLESAIGAKLETISSGPNLEMDKFEAVMTEMVSAEVTTVIEAQQSENKARMAEMKAEMKAQQTEIKAEMKAQQTEIKAEMKAQQTEKQPEAKCP
ncbi:hypothetical protein THAOC_35130, partial [Thalassiosira oceanica]